jgi:hypothetical protein
MHDRKASNDHAEQDESRPYRARLPGFITEESVGLGDVIKRVTYTLGIKPCGSSEHRAAILNRCLVFTGRAK